MSREGKLELTEEIRLVQPCLREFQKGAQDSIETCAQLPPGESFADRPGRSKSETQRYRLSNRLTPLFAIPTYPLLRTLAA